MRAHVLRGEADGLFDVLPDRAAAAVKIRGLRVEICDIPLLQRNVIGVHDQPEVVIRVDARDRLPALGGEEIVVAVAVLILLGQEQFKFLFCPVKLKRDHGENILRGIAHADAAERTGGVVADIPGETEVPLHLVGVPDVDHRLRVLVREAALEAGEEILPAVRQLLHGRGEKVRGFAGGKGLGNLALRHLRAEINIERFCLSGAERQRQLQREARVAAEKCGIFQVLMFESDRRFLAAVAADKFITVAVKPGCGHIACKIHQRRLIGLRLVFHTVAVDEHAVLFIDGQLVLVVALPLQLAHEFHHAKLDVGVNRHIPVTVRSQLQMPEHDVFQRTDQICNLGAQTITFCRKAGVAHAVRGLPFLGLAGARLIGRTPDGIAVLDVGIKSAAVGRQVEEAVVVDAPDLRGFIPRNAAACLRDHRVERPVGQIVHPRGRHIVPGQHNFPILILKTVWVHLSVSVLFCASSHCRSISSYAYVHASWPQSPKTVSLALPPARCIALTISTVSVRGTTSSSAP